MRYFFSHLFSTSRQPGSPHNIFDCSPLAAASRHGVKLLVSSALLLIGLGVLILLFPLVLAVFVAALFFLIALLCLNFAWRVYRGSKKNQPSSERFYVKTHPLDHDLI